MSDGVDLLQGCGMNRDFAISEEAPIVYASTSLHPYVDEVNALTFVLDNQFAASAVVTVDIYYALGA